MGTSKAQVMLVDDHAHAIFREGMEMLINRGPDMEVVAEGCDGEGTLALLTSDHNFHIVLMDVSLKTHSGLEVIKRVHNKVPGLPVLVV